MHPRRWSFIFHVINKGVFMSGSDYGHFGSYFLFSAANRVSKQTLQCCLVAQTCIKQLFIIMRKLTYLIRSILAQQILYLYKQTINLTQNLTRIHHHQIIRNHKNRSHYTKSYHNFILLYIKMNKKKYVKKSQVQQSMNTSTIVSPKTERTPNDRSLTQSTVSMRVSNFDSDEDENQVSLDLTFDDKKILHLWLVELLPGKFTKIKVSLVNKKITGNVLQCQKKIDQCNQYIGNHVLKAISDLDEKINRNFMMVMDLKFKLKIFQKTLVQDACKQIVEKYKYRQIEKAIQKFATKKIYYLVSVCKEQSNEFGEWFEQNKNQSFTREQIAEVYNLNRNQSSKSLLIKGPSTFSKVKSEAKFKKTQVIEDEQKQSSVKDESSEEEQNSFYDFYGSRIMPKKQQKLKVAETKPIKTDAEQQQTIVPKKKKYISKNSNPAQYLKEDISLIRTQKAKNVHQVQYPATVFDYQNFKKWVRVNKILNLDDFQCKIDPLTIKISLIVLKESDSKLSAFKMYLQFEKLITIDNVGNDNRKVLQDKYCQQNTHYLKCEIIEGFREPETHEHRLRRLIKQNRITQSDRRNKRFCVVWIVGLSPLVQKRYKELQDFIDELPKSDKQQKIILNLQLLEQYILQDSTERIKNFVKDVIALHMKKYHQLTLMDVKYPLNKIAIIIKIKHTKYDEFMRGQNLNKFKDEVKNCFDISEIIDESDFTKELNQKYLLCRSLTNSKKFVLITDRNRGNLETKQILQTVSKNNSELRTSEIRFKKGRLQQLKNYIQELKKEPVLKGITSNIKITFDENLLQFFGTNKNINIIEEQVKLFLNKIDDSILEKTWFISDSEAMVVEKNMKRFSQQIQNQFKLDFNLSKGVDFGAVFAIDCQKVLNLDSPLIIFVEKHKNILKMPNQTLFCFQNQYDLNFCGDKSLSQIKAFFSGQNKLNISKIEDTEKDYTYIYSEGFKSPNQMLIQILKNYPYKNMINRKILAFIMPKVNKCQFLLQIFQTAQKYLKQNTGNKIKIHIFEDPTEDIKTSLSSFMQKYQKGSSKVRYYVFDKKQFYYSKQGEQKIDLALKNNQKNVYLTNQDLNLQIFTHTCSFKEMKLRHNQSGKQFKLEKKSFKDYYFEIKGIKFYMPQKQVKIVQDAIQKSGDHGTQVSVSIGAYELDLVNMKQYNLFSGFTRDLQKQQFASNTKGTGKIFVSFDEKVNEIQIAYENKQEIDAKKACQKLKELIQAEKIKLDHVLDQAITKQQFQNLKCIEQELSLVLEWDGNKNLTITSFDKINISIFLKNLKFYIHEQKQVMKLPQTWIHEQKSQIETFVVAPNTKQFIQIQAKFRIAQIKELVRIQNLIVYKKFHDQKVFLTNLNKGTPIKTMNLFHGTRSTDPKQIYEDKQQSFNINYTSDSNYLGRGTYFAETPQYSHNYRYTNQKSSSFLSVFKQPISEMFYCEVLVGDSQPVPVVDQKSRSMKDTDYKNPTQRIRYQSATIFTDNSNIYTVYKNRRAYPHYLIRY